MVLNYKVFEKLSKQGKGFGGEIQLTDSLVSLIDSPGLFGTEFKGQRYDCGSKLGFVKANLGFAINDSEIKKEIKNNNYAYEVIYENDILNPWKLIIKK